MESTLTWSTNSSTEYTLLTGVEGYRQLQAILGYPYVYSASEFNYPKKEFTPSFLDMIKLKK